MEDAANILGAGILRTTLRVTLPMALPAILGGAIVTFLEAIALFGSPALIAIPARFNVVTTQLLQFFSQPIRAEVAAAYAVPLLLITVVMFGLQRQLVRRRGFVALTGKGGERRVMEIGPWRWVMLGYSLFILSLSVLLPYIVLGQAALSKAWGRGFSLDNLTLHNFTYLLFEHETAARSVMNSFTYAAAAACIAITLGLSIAYIASRRLLPFSGVLSFLCMAPFVVPGIVLAIAFYAAYAPPPFALYGTATILILAFATRFLPVGFRQCRRGDPGDQPGNGGGGADPGRRAADRDPPGAGAADEAQPDRRLAAGVHPRDAGTVQRDVPVRPEDPHHVGHADGHERGGQFREPRGAGLPAADFHPGHRRHRHRAAGPGLHAAPGAAMTDSKLSLIGLGKSFGSVPAVIDVSLSLRAG